MMQLNYCVRWGPICGVIGGVSNMLDYVMSKRHFYIQFFYGLIVALSLNRASVEADALPVDDLHV
jgi:hypothetical protein